MRFTVGIWMKSIMCSSLFWNYSSLNFYLECLILKEFKRNKFSFINFCVWQNKYCKNLLWILIRIDFDLKVSIDKIVRILPKDYLYQNYLINW